METTWGCVVGWGTVVDVNLKERYQTCCVPYFTTDPLCCIEKDPMFFSSRPCFGTSPSHQAFATICCIDPSLLMRESVDQSTDPTRCRFKHSLERSNSLWRKPSYSLRAKNLGLHPSSCRPTLGHFVTKPEPLTRSQG